VFDHILYVPELAGNLFSLKAAVSKNNIIQFRNSRCWIRGASGRVFGMASLNDKLYRLNCSLVSQEQACVASEQRRKLNLWHERFGHLNKQQLKEIVRYNLATKIKILQSAKLSFCEACVKGKSHRRPFNPIRENQSSEPLRLVHSDVCGPMHTGGRKYFVTFVDNYSLLCRVFYETQG